MKRKLLITGAGGFAGSRLCAYYKERYEVLGCTHEQLDFTDLNAVERLLEKERPEIVIHAGAISSTGICEQNPDLSYLVNVKGTKNIADSCHKIGAKMIFMSSDQIYNGNSELEPHREEEKVHPVNVYGRHKLEAEERILDSDLDVICLRLAWMYDFPGIGKKKNKNFITNILEAVHKRIPIKAPLHEYRGITYVKPVIEELEKTFDIPKGIYNYGSENTWNTYQTTEQAFYIMQQKEISNLLKEDGERYKTQPRNLAMNTEKIREHGIIFPDTLEGIQSCVWDWKKNCWEK